jgi:hypothetical protein
VRVHFRSLSHIAQLDPVLGWTLLVVYVALTGVGYWQWWVDFRRRRAEKPKP